MRVNSRDIGLAYDINAAGPVVQMDLAVTNGPGPTLAASATFDSGPVDAMGFKIIAAAVKMNQAGTLAITRYLDDAGLMQQGAAASVTVTAGQTAVLNVGDNLPFRTVRLTLANGASSAAAIAAFAFLLNAD